MTIIAAAQTTVINSLGKATVLLAQGGTVQGTDGPVGPEFGKAAPIGLLVLVIAAVVVLSLGWAFYRRHTRFQRRRVFAEANGIDVFDEEAVNKAMAEAGVLDRGRKRFV